MKRLFAPIILLLTAMHFAAAADFSGGMFCSPKGLGISADITVADGQVRNSWNIYADMYGVYRGSYGTPGVKCVYLHYGRIGGVELSSSSLEFLLAPGGAVGYVRDKGSDGNFGVCTSAAFAGALKVAYPRGFDLEFGMVLEAGFFSVKEGRGANISLYENGIRQALMPHIKIMYRFR